VAKKDLFIEISISYCIFLAISETIAAVVNGTSSSSPPLPKRSRPSRPRSTPTKNSVIIAPTPPSRLFPSSSVEDDTSSMESTSTSNSIQSTMADLLDRCSSPPIDNDIRSCLNDLCQRVALNSDEPSTSMIYNPIPSPVFKRKIEEQSLLNKQITKTNNHIEEPTTPKKKRNRSSAKKSSTDITNVTIPINKREETIEQETPDIKPTIFTMNATTSDYICEWDNCRK
jgi:hypothetical protein